MDLPTLDCHAHISPTVTDGQLQGLGGAIVFAMTREPTEAAEATRRYDPNILWGCGAHPSYVARGGNVDVEQFARRAKRFAIVGEVGLDRRSGNLVRQTEILTALVDRLKGEPVLMSMHSAGCSAEVLQLLEQHCPAGVIMHWFTGRQDEAEKLLSLGCYFSVNTAMRPDMLAALPLDRLLPETDFPVAQKRTGTKPGDTSQVETLLASIHRSDPLQIRRHFYRNLRRLSVETGAIDRMPARLVDMLLLA